MYKGRGVELTRAGNRWYFRTAPDLGDRLKLEKMVPRKLSRAGTETLAIIAYHQPVTRAEIEEIRGVVISKGTIDILLEEGASRCHIAPITKEYTCTLGRCSVCANLSSIEGDGIVASDVDAFSLRR